MTIDDQIKVEKLQCIINRETAKSLSALSSGEIDKNEYLICEEIIPHDQSGIIEETKFTYSLQKRLQKKKQIEALKVLKSDVQQLSIKDFISKNKPNPEIVNELERIGKVEEKIDRNKIFYKRYKIAYDFTKDKTLHTKR